MTEDAFARRFYADRAELDALGIQLRVDKPAEGFSEQENYSLAPEAFHLPAIAFTDDEHAALQTALSLLDGEFAYAEPLRLALQQITWGRPSPFDSRGAELGRAGHVGERRRRGALRPPGEDRHRDRAPQADRVRVLHDAVGRGRRTPRRSLPAAVPGPPVLPRRLLARARRRARLPPLAHPRQGRLRHQGRARLPAACGLRPARVRQPHPVAARRHAGHRRDLGVGPHRLARRAQLRAVRRDRRRDLPHRLRDPAAGDRVGARLRRARPHHRAAGARRRGARAARRDRRAPHRRAVHQRRRGHAAGRRGSRGRRGAPALAPGGRDPPRALRPPRHARLRADRRRPRGPPPAGERGARAPADLRAGAARGHLGAQRRQLRRRRLRDLRRGPGRRDRDRHRALLGHVRPPRAAAADRGQRADGGDRVPRHAPLRPPRRRPTTRSRPRSARSAATACWSAAPARTTPTSRATSAARSSRAT